MLIALLLPAAALAQNQGDRGPVLSDGDLLAMAQSHAASNELPLGDGRYVTNGPRAGYIYLCHPMGGGGGAQRQGGWVHGNIWNPFEKPAVEGDVTWPGAQFSNRIEGAERILSGNGLPIGQPTGLFPIQPSDPAYAYDRNPNRVTPQTIHEELPVTPLYSATPFCMGAEVGIMLNGVKLFNGFDAGMRDAAAHEIQDRCAGHPQRSGQYHYHSLSPCLTDIGQKTVIGYALDGFPITGPEVAPDRFLTTADLDVCHGLTSEIVEDGQRKITYHYVMTRDFPYSASCFRARPVRIGPSGPAGGSGARQSGPPPEALAACETRSAGSSCQFQGPGGNAVSGTCRSPQGRPLACAP